MNVLKKRKTERSPSGPKTTLTHPNSLSDSPSPNQPYPQQHKRIKQENPTGSEGQYGDATSQQRHHHDHASNKDLDMPHCSSSSALPLASTGELKRLEIANEENEENPFHFRSVPSVPG